jgi:hypothetical protein
MTTLETHNGPNFDIDLERGQIGEDLHKEFLLGKHEVKTDFKAMETNNFYIEYNQLNGNGYKPSGIEVTEADFWVEASPLAKGGFYIKMEFLRALIKKNNYPVRPQPKRNQHTNASVGYLIPIIDIVRELGFLTEWEPGKMEVKEN